MYFSSRNRYNILVRAVTVEQQLTVYFIVLYHLLRDSFYTVQHLCILIIIVYKCDLLYFSTFYATFYRLHYPHHP